MTKQQWDERVIEQIREQGGTVRSINLNQFEAAAIRRMEKEGRIKVRIAPYPYWIIETRSK